MRAGVGQRAAGRRRREGRVGRAAWHRGAGAQRSGVGVPQVPAELCGGRRAPRVLLLLRQGVGKV
eukprot:361070-Chlamydomonas_euryale.AAC.3